MERSEISKEISKEIPGRILKPVLAGTRKAKTMLQRSPNTRLVARRQAFPRRHRSRPYHQNGEQVAVIRALTGARLHLGLPIPAPTLSEAARMAGTHVGYIQAAIAVLRAEDETLIEAVRTGEIALLKAAAQVKRRAELITALRRASPDDRAAAGRALGVAAIFDECVVPNLD
jgi:hypothetical protein